MRLLEANAKSHHTGSPAAVERGGPWTLRRFPHSLTASSASLQGEDDGEALIGDRRGTTSSATLTRGLPYVIRQTITTSTWTLFFFSSRVWTKHYFPPLHRISWSYKDRGDVPEVTEGGWVWKTNGSTPVRDLLATTRRSVQPSRDPLSLTTPMPPTHFKTRRPGKCWRQQNLLYSRFRLRWAELCW